MCLRGTVSKAHNSQYLLNRTLTACPMMMEIFDARYILGGTVC